MLKKPFQKNCSVLGVSTSTVHTEDQASIKKPLTFAFTNSRSLSSLTICSTSVETICMQHMAVARAHTIVEMTLRAQTLKSSSLSGGADGEAGGGRVRGGKEKKEQGSY